MWKNTRDYMLVALDELFSSLQPEVGVGKFQQCLIQP